MRRCQSTGFVRYFARLPFASSIPALHDAYIHLWIGLGTGMVTISCQVIAATVARFRDSMFGGGVAQSSAWVVPVVV